METRIKGLIFILDSYMLSLEVGKISLKIDKDFNSNQHIYLQFPISKTRLRFLAILIFIFLSLFT